MELTILLLLVLLIVSTVPGVTSSHNLRASTTFLEELEVGKKNVAGSLQGEEDEEQDLLEFVDHVRGVRPNHKDFSFGNVLPLIARPRSMTHWSVTTTEDLREKWYFSPDSFMWAGIRCTHQPSPWIGDYGQFIITALFDGLGTRTYGPRRSTYKPNLFETELVNFCSEYSCTKIKFSPSAHGGMLYVRFPRGMKARTRRINIINAKASGVMNVTSPIMEGYSSMNTGGVINVEKFKHFFSAQFEFQGPSDSRTDMQDDFQCDVNDCTGTISWKMNQDIDDVVLVRIGTSFISMEQARLNAQQELGKHDTIDDLVKEGRDEWNSLLSRVQVVDGGEKDPYVTKAKKTTLYTNLYRALLFPRNLGEIDAQGNEVHFSPFDSDGKVMPGPLSVDSGFWDAYRTVYPMLHLIYPEIARKVMHGWFNSMMENEGRTPQWPSPGSRREMVGTMSDVSMSEALVNGAFTKEQEGPVYQSLLKNAYDGSGSSSRGENDLPAYEKLGYIPERVAETLNFLLADYAISRAARYMNDTENADRLEKRSKRWTEIFDPETALFRPKNVNGTFDVPFDQFAWKAPEYTEGGPWQYRFYTPHDPQGLKEAYEKFKPGVDGKSRLCNTLMEAMIKPPTFHMPFVIHEASEMAINCWGLYGHNNQPTHHILYMFADAGCATEGQLYIQHAVATLYGDFGYSGDEDNGEMSSWHILSALGLYARVPSEGYQVGAPPLFSKTVIKRLEEHQDDLVIVREPLRTRKLNNMTDVKYKIATDVRWKGKGMSLMKGESVSIPYHELLKGGELTFY